MMLSIVARSKISALNLYDDVSYSSRRNIINIYFAADDNDKVPVTRLDSHYIRVMLEIRKTNDHPIVQFVQKSLQSFS